VKNIVEKKLQQKNFIENMEGKYHAKLQYSKLSISDHDLNLHIEIRWEENAASG
jgi:hypothetical protein